MKIILGRLWENLPLKNMAKIKDSLTFLGEGGKEGMAIVKTAGQAIVVVGAVVVVGALIGVTGNAFGGGG